MNDPRDSQNEDEMLDMTPGRPTLAPNVIHLADEMHAARMLGMTVEEIQATDVERFTSDKQKVTFYNIDDIIGLQIHNYVENRSRQ